MSVRSLFRFGFAAATAAAALLAASCGGRAPVRTGLSPGTPYISWIIMYGDRDNADREFACQSDPRTDCVLPPSAPGADVFSAVYLYLHGAGGETKYQGTVQIGFLRGGGPSRVDMILKKNEAIGNHSVNGIVTAAPGTYNLAFDVTATVAEPSRTHPIQQQVAVLVRR